MARISLKFLVLTLLLLSQIDVRLAEDEDDGGSEEEATTAAPKSKPAKAPKAAQAPPAPIPARATPAPAAAPQTPAAAPPAPTAAPQTPAAAPPAPEEGGGGGANGGLSKEELQKKYDKVKNDKSGNAVKGKTGKIMQVVIEAIKEINPIRLMQEFDLDPILTVNGINVEKLQIPVNYLSDSFFDKLAEKVKKSKKDLTTELGCDVEAKKEGEWISIGKMLKLGKKNNLKFGDYLLCLGVDMRPYEAKYDNFLIEAVRVPVQFIDEISTEGFTKYINAFKEYVNSAGGPLNAGLKAYTDYSGKDPVAETQKAIKAMKAYNSTGQISREQYAKNIEESRKNFIKKVTVFYNEWFGKGGRIFVYQARITKILNDISKIVNSYTSADKLQSVLSLMGNAIGPEGKAITYIIYQPTQVYLNQIYGPLLLIPKIILQDGEFMEKLLALPPIIIQTSAGIFKPSLMIVEPFGRLLRFLITGEYTKSISCGLDVTAANGISIWGGAYKPKSKTETPQKPQKRTKRETRREKKLKAKAEKSGETTKKPITPEEAAKYTRSDQKMAEAYQGGPPPGGYKLGVKNDGSLDLDDEDMISRLLLSPDFILKVGGPVFVPFASVLAPALRAVNTILFGKGDLPQRVAEVPDIIRGVGIIGPLADIVQAAHPFVKTGYNAFKGNLTVSQVIVQAPGLIKQLATGPISHAARNPFKLIKQMFGFLEGHGGLIAMLRLQANNLVPRKDPGAAGDPIHDLGPEANLIIRFAGNFFGGWFLTYFQALGPVGSMNGAFFNGLIGNIIDAVKFVDTKVNLKQQPLKHMLEIFDDLPKMLSAAADKKTFLTAVLGGQDPDVLNEIGISAEKLAQNNIDPGMLLAGGKKFVGEEAAKKLENEGGLEALGIDSKGLAKVDLDVKVFIESGLLDAKYEKMRDFGIDLDAIFNRVLRNSVEDESRLHTAGIELKLMLKAGVCPLKLLSAGASGLPEETIKALGISNPNELTDDNIKALGLNPTKLHSKGINAKKLAEEGIESQSHLQKNLGIDAHKLLLSAYTGMDPNRTIKAGIDLKAMLKAGIDTKLLLTGGLKKAVKDPSPAGFEKAGINTKKLMAIGINYHMVTEVGATVLNPMNLVKMGIDPMSTMIMTLSRHGLDTMTGGVDDPVAVSFGFVNSILRIINNMIGLVPKLRELPGGKTIIGPDGRFVGAAGFLFYNIIGIDNTGGLLGLLQKIYSGKFTTAEILNMINPVRLTNELAHPHKKPAKLKKIKPNQKSVDSYISKSQNLRVGDARKSAIYGKNDPKAKDPTESDVYDESKYITTEAPATR